MLWGAFNGELCPVVVMITGWPARKNHYPSKFEGFVGDSALTRTASEMSLKNLEVVQQMKIVLGVHYIGKVITV